MDPSGVIPELLKVIEERLGRLGRPFTTLIVVTFGLGVVAWGSIQTKGLVVDLLSNVENAEDIYSIMIRSTLVYAFTMVLGLITVIIVDRIVFAPCRKRFKEYAENVVRLHKEAVEIRTEVERDARVLRARFERQGRDINEVTRRLEGMEKQITQRVMEKLRES